MPSNGNPSNETSPSGIAPSRSARAASSSILCWTRPAASFNPVRRISQVPPNADVESPKPLLRVVLNNEDDDMVRKRRSGHLKERR